MVNPYPKSRKIRQKSRRKQLFLWGGFVVLIFCVGLVIGQFNTRDESMSEPVVVAATAPKTREVILYFSASDGQSLIAETRHINDCLQEDDCLRDTVMELISGPQNDLSAIIPAQTKLRSVTVQGSLVQIDLSQELISAHPGGTQSELLTIYGLADTMAVNFPHLRQIRVLVEGAPAATLKGHIDLRQPINPDFSLVEEGLASGGRIISVPAGDEE